MNRFTTILFFVLLLGSTANAQQWPLDNQYQINRYSLAPAYAGFSGNTETFFSFRQNWIGIPGAARKQFINVNMPFQKETAGIGISVTKEETGNLEYFSGLFTYAYHVELSDDMSLSLSLSAEAYRNQLDISSVKSYQTVDGQDPYLANNSSLRGSTVDATFSTVFYMNKLSVGVVVPRMIGMKVKYDSQVEGNQYGLARHYLAFASYPIEAAKDLVVEPFVVGRMTQNSPFFYEATVMARYKKMLWGSATYRKGNTIGVSLGGALDYKIVMNYTYEFGFGRILSFASGTHEISLGYLIKYGKRNKDMSIFREEPPPPAPPEDSKELKKLKKELTTYKKQTDEKIAELEKKIDEIGDAEPNSGIKYKPPYILENIQFGTNSDKLFSSSFPELDKLARKLTTNKTLTIRIVGYTDNEGSPKYNLQLSKKRALAVKEYLVTVGKIDAARIETDGKGEQNSIASNETREGRAKNRRIEVEESAN